MTTYKGNLCMEIPLNPLKKDASDHLVRLKHIFVEMEKFYAKLITEVENVTIDVFERNTSAEIIQMVGRISGWEDDILDSMHYLSQECITLNTWQLLQLDHLRSLIEKMQIREKYEKYGL